MLASPTLEITTLQDICFWYALFANNVNNSTQIEYIIFMSDDYSSIIPIIYKSYEARKIVHFVLAGRLIASTDKFNSALALGTFVKYPFSSSVIPLTSSTDSKSHLAAIFKG